uniref:VWFA domain-containing protein n=1 Tax=Mola mola TaxID=94237 RepID=A0A3Q3VZT2_MOLML
LLVISRFFLLLYSIPGSLTFNIDLTSPDVYNGEKNYFFGYKVLQFMSGKNKGIIITAPLNGSGAICNRDQSQNIQCFKQMSFKDTKIPVKHLGLSIAKHSTQSQFTVKHVREYRCSNPVCVIFLDKAFLFLIVFLPLFSLDISSECTKKTVDLVFLFDGSNSMTDTEFETNKHFIKDIMKNLNGTSIKFAAVQFSLNPRKVFDFNDYQAGIALDKLESESHMKSLTNTYKALKFVFILFLKKINNIFDNPATGASPDATQVVVVITDGDPSDSNGYYHIIEKYNERNIIRFVIGVKDAKLEKFKEIVSEPKDKNAFKIEHYNGLTGILENLQKKIFKMEGTKLALAGEMKNEMSQSGFSAVFHKDRLILGSVGSNSWRGSLQELHEGKTTQIEDPHMLMDSYLGYSTAVGEKRNAPLYFAGAPRFNHMGQIVLFRHDGKNWNVVERINGSQIGSYFGAELCSVDVNSDGNTDFLLVGAPLFYHSQEKREGQIYVYTLTDELQLKSELSVTGASMGRFGTSIASLADLNGDGLRDVAVGAPLEDENRGVVYIFLGDRHQGIRSTFSQRIMGQKIRPEMRFFGQAIDGDIDLGDDGLPDIVVGSQGMAAVLRSRPVFDVTAHLSFHPKEISTDDIDCLVNTEKSIPAVILTACFEVIEMTKRNAGEPSSGLNISCMFDVDPLRQASRGFFSQADKKARNHNIVYTLWENYTCFNYSVHMPVCVKDTLSPLGIKLNFSQEDSENASFVLNVDSNQQAFIEIPFQKHCRKNDTCIAELEVDFNFMKPTLLVAEDSYFNLSVKLSNHGDDSYNTSLSMHYPPGLSFSRMVLTKWTRPTLHSCRDQEVLDKTVCGVSLPVYRSRSATFEVSFHIMNEYDWNDTVLVTVRGLSDNTNSTKTNSLTKSIPVQFEIKMAVTVREDTISYLNFTTEDTAPKKLVVIYKIDNPGLKAFPVNVSLFFPTELEYNFEMNNYQVSVAQNKTQCTASTKMTSEYCSQEKNCKLIVCDTFILEKESTTEFRLSGDVQFRHLKQRAANISVVKRYTGDSAEVKFKSFMRVSYDKQRYVLDSHKQQTEVRVEFIIPPYQLQIIFTGVGLGFLLLVIITVIMFKLGCFKRKKLYQEQEEEKEEEEQDFAPLACAPAATEVVDKSEQLPEEKLPLNDDTASSSTLD